MAGTTTYYGISYPTSTDYVKDGATAMQTIADGFDSAVAIPTYNNQTGTSYTFVLTDAGKTVTSNNASAVTFTIPPQSSVAWAANTTLTVRNLGAGVVTIAGGAGVTVTNTAQTVAQYGSVRIIRTASNAWTVVPASGGASGLTLVKAQTVGTTVSSVIITDAFNSTYDNYRIIYRGGTGSAGSYLNFQMRTGTTNSTASYYFSLLGSTFGNVGAGEAGNNTSSFNFVGYASSNGWSHLNVDVFNPFIASETTISILPYPAGDRTYYGAGAHAVDTSYDQIVMGVNSGTITGGTIYIYGYQK